MAVREDTARGYVYVPDELVDALRNRIRMTFGDEIANAPFGALLRFAAAIAAGLTGDTATDYINRQPRKQNRELV